MKGRRRPGAMLEAGERRKGFHAAALEPTDTEERKPFTPRVVSSLTQGSQASRLSLSLFPMLSPLPISQRTKKNPPQMTAPGRGYIGRAVASPNGIAAGSLSWFSSARWTLKGKEWCLFSVFIEGVTGPLTGHFFEGEKGGDVGWHGWTPFHRVPIQQVSPGRQVISRGRLLRPRGSWWLRPSPLPPL